MQEDFIGRHLSQRTELQTPVNKNVKLELQGVRTEYEDAQISVHGPVYLEILEKVLLSNIVTKDLGVHVYTDFSKNEVDCYLSEPLLPLIHFSKLLRVDCTETRRLLPGQVAL